MFSLVALAVCTQVDLSSQLARGPLVLVEEGTGGRFAQATGFMLVDAPADATWAVLTRFGAYKSFMPKVTESTVKRQTDTEVDLRMVIDVPGPDTDYIVRFAIDAPGKELQGTWAGGDLKGSRWFWKVQAAPEGRSLLTYTLSAKNFSGIAQAVEDEAQTVTVGVNVSSVLAGLKAVKRQAEVEAKASATKQPPAHAGTNPPPRPSQP